MHMFITFGACSGLSKHALKLKKEAFSVTVKIDHGEQKVFNNEKEKHLKVFAFAIPN